MDKKEYQKQWVKNHRHPCIDCGEPVVNPKALRCRSCSLKNIWQGRSKLEKSLIIGRGKDNSNWKGGRWRIKAGYVMIYAPNHPRATATHPYIYEHIGIWEETHHQPLPDGWVVHHLNGIKYDNRPQNLLGMPQGGHSSSLVLGEVQKRLRKVEAELSQQRLY